MKMESKYEVIVFRRNDFFSLLERLIRGNVVGMRVRALGEKLKLPGDAEIIDNSEYLSSEERYKKIKEFEKRYRIDPTL